MKTKAGFDWAMHDFRAFAIVNIIIVHYLSALGFNDVKNAFFQNATVYFLFISGYLCQYLGTLKPRSALAYYKSKVTNVLSPYLVWSLVFFLLTFIEPYPHEGSALMDLGRSPFAFLWYLVAGRVSFPYWYIPFVTLLFIVSPFLVRMRGSRLFALTLLFATLFVVFPDRPIYFSFRPTVFFALYCHFTVFYLAGFVYARRKEVVDRFVAEHVPLFVGLVLLVTAAILLPSSVAVSTAALPTLQSLQKILVALLVIRAFDRIRDRRVVLLDALARYSFTLYFIHCYFLTEALAVRRVVVSYLGALTDFVLVPLYVLALLGLAVLLKGILKSRSRALIGT